ncbi:MAG: hypothetical protein WDM89_04740 [Rhizomicrobium sp.]
MAAKAQPKAKTAKKAVKKAEGDWPPKSISEEKVMAATGRGWMGWFSILNNMNANALPHKDVAQRLREEYDAPRWWNQMIAVEYERGAWRKEKERTRRWHVRCERHESDAGKPFQTFRSGNKRESVRTGSL